MKRKKWTVRCYRLSIQAEAELQADLETEAACSGGDGD